MAYGGPAERALRGPWGNQIQSAVQQHFARLAFRYVKGEEEEVHESIDFRKSLFFILKL